MPTTTTNFQFAGGVDEVPGYGDKWIFGFSGTYAQFETWQLLLATSLSGDITLGLGNWNELVPTVALTYRSREYVGLTVNSGLTNADTIGSQFNFSDNYDPSNKDSTGPAHAWEEQNAGAGFEPYLSQFGSQDAIVGLSVLQGRLVVLGQKSIQIWTVDADPANFSLNQALDNIGTFAKRSVQQLGDFDVLFLDETGFRSVRAREVTNNAYPDDIGTPVDSFVQAAIATMTPTQKAACCGVVDPRTKNYWCFVEDTIYVFARYLTSKVAAWSTYEPRGDDNQLFVPEVFCVLNSQIFARANNAGNSRDYLYTYGGSNNATYDTHSQITFVTPYLDDKRPGTMKQLGAISAVMEGNWTINVSTDVVSNNYVPFLTKGDTANPSPKDSTYDVGNVESPLRGTHFSIKCVSNNQSTSLPAVFSSILVYYNPAEPQG